MTVTSLGAWCDYVTEEEYLSRFTSTSVDDAGAPTGSGWAAWPGGSSSEVDAALEHFRMSASFRVHEYAVLSDGRRLTLDDPLNGERGFSSRTRVSGGDGAPIDQWAGWTLDELEASVLTTVLPDEDNGDQHPWEWLAQRLRDHGIETTPEQLRNLPYDVEFSQRLRDRVAWRT